jgi:hypothetical protein
LGLIVDIKADTSKMLARVQNMYDDLLTAKLETLPSEFEAWQVDDMHRKYPEVTFHPGEQEAIVMTRIWPHSRDEIAGGARVRRLYTIPKNISHKQVLRYEAQSRAPSGRPILRAELYEQLHARMVGILDSLKWRDH